MSIIIAPTDLIPLTTLGRGSYGKVILSKYEAKGEIEPLLVAVKVVSKIRIKTTGQLLKNITELRVMKEVSPTCKFLVNTFGGYQTDHCLFYLMPYSGGGELFFHLQRQGHFMERETRQICMQVVLALEHLHKHGIVYRDLKPENVLIGNTGVCQLADFGLSKYLERLDHGSSSQQQQQQQLVRASNISIPQGTQSLRKSSIQMLVKPALGMASRVRGMFRKSTTTQNTFSTGAAPAAALVKKPSEVLETNNCCWGRTKTRCGSPAYQSPEVVEAKEHGLESDWWALGIFIYELMVGNPPFFADTVKEVYELILRNEPRWSRKLTDSSRSLIQLLLKTNPKQRLGYGEDEGRAALKAHEFFMNVEPHLAEEGKYASWEQVENLETKPCVFLSDTGVVGNPEDAVFFHSEFTSIDVREYVPVCPKKIDVEGFKKVGVESFQQFVSAEPIAVGTKGGEEELKKNL